MFTAVGFWYFEAHSTSFAGSGLAGLFLLVLMVFHIGFVLARAWEAIRARGKPKFTTATWATLFCLLIADTSVFVAKQISSQNLEETKRIGDQFVAEIEAATLSKDLPLFESQQDLEASGLGIAKTRFPNSQFKYAKVDEGEFSVSFPAPRWMVCERTNKRSRWRCFD
jgi:hypothetical protein